MSDPETSSHRLRERRKTDRCRRSYFDDHPVLGCRRRKDQLEGYGQFFRDHVLRRVPPDFPSLKLTFFPSSFGPFRRPITTTSLKPAAVQRASSSPLSSLDLTSPSRQQTGRSWTGLRISYTFVQSKHLNSTQLACFFSAPARILNSDSDIPLLPLLLPVSSTRSYSRKVDQPPLPHPNHLRRSTQGYQSSP